MFYVCKCSQTCLEAGCDGGIFVVSGLCVAYEVIPASEHLPAKCELSLLPIPTANISIFGHSGETKQF